MALFHTYPLVRYHPIFGRVEFPDQESAQKAMVPEHDWSETPEDADRKRTQREADLVVHNSRRVMLDSIVNEPQHEDHVAAKEDDEDEPDTGATVMHSVQHTEVALKPMLVSPEERADEQARVDDAEELRREGLADEAPAHTEAG